VLLASASVEPFPLNAHLNTFSRLLQVCNSVHVSKAIRTISSISTKCNATSHVHVVAEFVVELLAT